MVRGGTRQGAGRPKGRGPHGEQTKVMRIPVSLTEEVRRFIENRKYTLPLQLPVFSSRVPAGLPAGADETVEEYMNLDQALVSDPKHMGIVYAQGDSMTGAGIFDGDMLLFNTLESAGHKKIVIASINGEQTVKRLHIVKGQYILMPENEHYKPIPIVEGMEFRIIGVVTACIRTF